MTRDHRRRWFLGTNYGHDAAAALIDPDGTLVFAVEEGRIIGEKNCSRFPSRSIELAMELVQDDVIEWAEGWDWNRRILHKGIGTSLRHISLEPRMLRHRLRKEFGRYLKAMAAASRWSVAIGAWPTFTGHHLAHALSLVPCGLQEQSLIVVSDTTGESESVTVFSWDGVTMRRLARSPWPNSPGSIFHQAAYFAGFPGERGPGKLMALAGHGQARTIEVLARGTEIREGRFHIDTRIYPAYRYSDAWDEAILSGVQGKSEWLRQAKGAQGDAADFAASVQEWFERALLDLASSAYSLARSGGIEVSDFALAGGSALNCQANGRLKRDLDKRGRGRLLLSPWSNDAGTAVGAAVYAALKGGVRRFHVESPLLGPHEAGVPTAKSHEIALAVDALTRGDIIGLVSGGVEFGPRALGGRAILADARRAELAGRLNRTKQRPAFMPFAPAVREELAGQWFDGIPSHDMAWTVRLLPGTADAFPGVDHPTGEARVQSVRRSRAPLLWELLLQCEEAAMPILLLTSLNGSGEPMLANAELSIAAARRLGAAGVLCDTGWLAFNA